MFSFLLKVICYGALLAYVGWALYALYRSVFKAGKNGSLPGFNASLRTMTL